MHIAQQGFCLKVKEKYPEHFKDVAVLDIGSLDVNGNNRYLFEDCVYTGLDLADGPNVDIVSKGHEFDPGFSYDTVISTEAFEHDQHWQETINNCIKLTKPKGLFLFTCASEGRPEHGTTRSRSPWASPFSHLQFNEYYRNLNEEDIRPLIESYFSEYKFEYNKEVADLYFYGIKQ